MSTYTFRAFLAVTLLLSNCGQVEVVDVATDGGISASDSGSLEIAPDSVATPDDATAAGDALADGGDVAVGKECATDFDCIDLPGKTACKMPRCQKGICVIQPQTPGTTCKSPTVAETDCSVPRCDEAAECVATPVKDGTLCGLGSCGKKCLAGSCVAAIALDYEDGNPCTKDYCDQGVKVVHEPVTDSQLQCDDGNSCTAQDSCKAGKCQGKAASCDDLIDCTADSCDAKLGCTHTADPKLCSDGNPCTTDGCDLALGCTASAASGASCDDGNACTQGDTCASGVCAGKSNCACTSDADCAKATTNLCLGPLSCQAGLCAVNPDLAVTCSGSTACTPVACDPKTGMCKPSPVANGTPCNDGNACTTASACQNGACSGTSAASCDDKNPCTADACDPVLGCQQKPTGGPCDDGEPCTSADSCQDGVCLGKKAQCDDGVACTVDSCDGSGACQHKGDPALCDDANPCTGATCTAKGCEFPPDDSAKCEDGDACTANTCKSGQCVAASICACKVDADCSDNNPCTADKCQGGKCIAGPVADGAACDSGDKCQKPGSGVCKAGACSGGSAPIDCSAKADACNTAACDPQTGACIAVPKADGSGCDADGSGCTQGDACAVGQCKPGKPLDCAALADACNTAACKSMSATDGQCVKVAKSAGTACSDGQFCTVGDTCMGGACQAGAALDCSKLDGACATGVCNESAKQCATTPKAASTGCSDGLACTAGDHCDGQGGCLSGAPVSCPGTLCLPAQCDEAAAGCKTSAAPSGKPCDDGQACTTVDVCDGQGACVGGAPKVCQGDSCNAASCDPASGACKLTPLVDGTACSDGNPCTSGDQCKTGKCSAGIQIICPSDACNDGTCNPTSGVCGKTPKPSGSACDDGQTCTTGDKCSVGICTSGTWTCSCKPATGAQDCNDAKPCTDDSCVQVGSGYQCQNKPVVGKTCDDGNLCTTGDVCTTAGLCAGSAVACDDGNACTLDQCDKATGKCVNSPNAGAACSDGTACTGGDVCTTAGQCVGKATVCDDGNACTANSCDPGSGACSFPAISGGCSDGNACTLLDTCVGGLCAAGKQVSCDDGNPCTSDACDVGTGLCKNTANALGCSDGDSCTVGDVCSGGKCYPGPLVTCNDGNPCTDDFCDKVSGKCVFAVNAAVCSDNNVCTLNDFCKGGNCYGGATKACSDGNPCTNDSCDPLVGCVAVNNTLTCNDGNACTSGDICSGGVCGGAPVNCNDNNVCTGDSCDPNLGCVYVDLDGKVCGVKYLCSKFPTIYCIPTCLAGICEKNPLL